MNNDRLNESPFKYKSPQHDDIKRYNFDQFSFDPIKQLKSKEFKCCNKYTFKYMCRHEDRMRNYQTSNNYEDFYYLNIWYIVHIFLKYGVLMISIFIIYINLTKLYKNNRIISEIYIVLLIYSIIILFCKIYMEVWYSLLDVYNIEYKYALIGIEYITHLHNAKIAGIIKSYLPAFYDFEIKNDISIPLVSLK